MFEYLQQIDVRIYDRYLTLEKSIKAGSNLFYDSYLNLQEQFLKAIAEKNAIEVAPHESCGALLKRAEIKALFLDYYKVDPHSYDKMGDYARKVNKHKHEKEKNVEVDTIINYMTVFYNVSSRCAALQGLTVPQFDGKYFKDIYGSMENLYSSIAEIIERLGRLEEGRQKQTEEGKHDESHGAQPEERSGMTAIEKAQRDRLILKNFIAKSEKKYNWFGSNAEFKKGKTILACVQLATIIVGFLSTFISSICFNLYSTFTLFENIVLIQMIILLSYTLKAKKHYGDYDLATHTPDMYARDSDGIWRDTGVEKKKYKILRRISYAAVILNIACIWTMGSGVIRIFATIFEVIFLGLTVASTLLRANHFCLYGSLYMRGLNASGTARVTLVHDEIQKKLCTLEEYQERYSDYA